MVVAARLDCSWAERKSRLAELDGFKFFTLMRRVGADGAEDDIPSDDPNYVSLTVRANRDRGSLSSDTLEP